MSSLTIFFLITSLLSALSAPVDPSTNEVEKPKQTYDYSQFDEVYDQRQNGTENWRVNLNKIVLVWAPPKDLITAAMLISPDLLGDSDFDDFLKPEKPEEVVVTNSEKPEAAVSQPEKPQEATTKEPEASTESLSKTVGGSTGRRILKLSSFLRPFVRRHHVQP